MDISLSSFEQAIDEVILNRGLNYFTKGAVKEFAESSAGEFIARVYGSDVYTIHLTIKNDKIVYQDCSCPYDGEVCKHVVAVIFIFNKMN